jgi:4-amino-4-deoxy-L-arabinose transferase-like glycosyltransferase
MFGRETGLAVLALMAFAPLQLHMGGHALIDGFFAFWATLAIWTLWEHLQQPAKIGWLAAYGASLAMMVITKENAFFVVIGIAGLLVLNRWMKFGDARPKLLYVTLLGPALGVVILIKLAGGIPSLFEIYHLLVVKAEHLDYAVLTGDGPWHRYLIDEVIVSPFVVCLAIGGIFTLARKERPMLFLTGFIVFTYAVMCQVRHGMNLRYATIWDFPLRALAAGQILDLYRMWGRSQRLAVCATVAVICTYELWQYWRFFVSGELYEIPTASLLQAVDVLKAQ